MVSNEHTEKDKNSPLTFGGSGGMLVQVFSVLGCGS